MISDAERKLIDEVQYEEDLSICVEIAKKSENPLFLFEYARSYNWDDGLDIAQAIADNPYCDLGTALSLFWLSEAMWYYIGESQRNEYNNEWADFCETITERLTSGYYKLGSISFRPADFNINRISEYKYNKIGVPKVLYKEVVGNRAH